jgi:hypothetical protein
MVITFYKVIVFNHLYHKRRFAVLSKYFLKIFIYNKEFDPGSE